MSTNPPRDSSDPGIQTDFDIHDPAIADTVYAEYDKLRSACPVAHSSAYGGHWVLTGYDDIQAVCRDAETFSSVSVNVPPSIGQDGQMIPLETDPPDHTGYRQILTPVFSPRRMAALEERIREIVAELLDAMEGRAKVDFVAAFAKELPTRVFLALMGWPLEDAARFHTWVDTIVVGVPGGTEEESMAARGEAAMAVYGYFSQMIDARAADPVERDDVTGLLLHGTFGDRELTRHEMLNMLFVLLIGGLHTVVGQLAHSAIFFAENPDKRRELVADPGLVNTAVEEMLRWESAVAPARVVTRDTVVGGVRMSAGDRVLIPLGAAGRDPAKFPGADEVDLAREPNPHLAFGAGRHRCLGSHLARVELRVAFAELHRRFPDYRLDPADPPVRHLSQVKGVVRLPLLLGVSA
ncbi:cytochrome P450 [Actinocorallia herbida]|uniref:Cytochrome P450 n=1 Tax=Actinocorallia herbida TaxID=58109 RepID=A0A3N1CX58_9ACTN|nr:cytochrome P450 [Actinocorallia herbida]ROO85308.1 cytochrome P450 [Actinocorallia herbida]